MDLQIKLDKKEVFEVIKNYVEDKYPYLNFDKAEIDFHWEGSSYDNQTVDGIILFFK
jgi:hypothetical protein